MQITDEMVDAAWVGWVNSIAANPLNIPSALRAALEAALGQFMLQYGDNVELQEAEQIGFNRSAACIEDLAAALRPFASFANIIDGDPAASPTGDPCPLTLDYNRINDGCFASLGDCRRARAALEKWGLK